MSMERTALREEFFRLAQEDPYLHLIQKAWADAWARGYEEACEVHDFECKSHYDLHDDALEYLTAHERRAEELVALAVLGTKMERLASEHIARFMDPRIEAFR